MISDQWTSDATSSSASGGGGVVVVVGDAIFLNVNKYFKCLDIFLIYILL